MVHLYFLYHNCKESLCRLSCHVLGAKGPQKVEGKTLGFLVVDFEVLNVFLVDLWHIRYCSHQQKNYEK